MRAEPQLEAATRSREPAPGAETALCPICRHEGASLVIADGGRSVHECRQCRFLFVRPRPSAEELKTLYSDEYFDGEDMAAANLRFRAPVFRQCLEGLRRLVPRHGRLLDIGCWTGEFVEAASRAGYAACGVELSTKAARFASGVRKLDVHNGTIFSAPLAAASFDAVTMLDVLEHVPDPIAELRQARALLRAGGILVVRVPNTAFHLLKTRICRLLRVRDVGLQTRHHLNHFTPGTLQATLWRAGFEVLSLGVGAPELIAHAAWATPWAKRAYVRLAGGVLRVTGRHIENITVAYARRKDR